MSVTYRQAITRGMADAMEADPDVFVLGEDVGAAGGAFKVTAGLYERFGARRVMDTPISEQAIVGSAIGAAIRGLRPVAEIMFADFAGVCFDGIANELAKYRYMTGGQVTVPVTLRLGNGAGAGFAAQHSQTCENWFLNVPGLKMVVPGTAADAYGLMRAAIEDPDPVLFFEHKHLYNHKDADEPGFETVPIGRAATVRAGEHITVVASQLMRHRAVEAADILAREDVSVEVIDPRTVAPLDMDTIRESVERTNHVVVVQEAPAAGSWGATVITALMQESFEMLDAPPVLLACDDTPVPYAEALEAAWMPDAARIAEVVRGNLAY